MARSRKHSRKSRKTRRGGAWYDPRTWFGQSTEETPAPVSQMTGSIESSESVSAGPPDEEKPPASGGRHRGRRHRRTKRRSH